MVRLIAVLAAVLSLGTGAARAADGFDIAGIRIGMKLQDAVAAMHATFAAEGLTDVHPVNTTVHRDGAILRLSLSQAASISTPEYLEDRFRLLAAGPGTDQVITGIVRDYLGPQDADTNAVLRKLTGKYGAPSSSFLPDRSVANAIAEFGWVFAPGGGNAGSGVKGSLSLACDSGLFTYQSYFDGFPPGDAADLAAFARQQSKLGCGRVMQISLSGEAVHYAVYDTAAAIEALQNAAAPAKGKAAAKPASPAAPFRY